MRKYGNGEPFATFQMLSRSKEWGDVQWKIGEGTSSNLSLDLIVLAVIWPLARVVCEASELSCW